MENTEKKGEETIEKRKEKAKNFFLGWIEDNYDKAFIFVLVIAFILQLWIFFKTSHQPLWYDEANFLATAKRLALGLDMNNIWYYRRGFLWVLIPAIFYKLGLGEIGIRFLIVLLSSGIVTASYLLISKMFDKKIGLMVSICMAFSWVVLFFTGRPLTDIPSTFLLLFSLLFFWKGYVLKEGNKNLYIFGIFFGLAMLMRFQNAMFVFPFLIIIFTKEKFKMFKNKHLWITLLIFFIVLSPHLVSYYKHYGNPVTDILTYYFGFSVGETKAGEVGGGLATRLPRLFDYFKDLPYSLSKPFFILFLIGVSYFLIDFILGIDKIFQNTNKQKQLFIFSWIILTFLILAYITEYVEQRYYMQSLPFLFAIACIPLLKLENLFIRGFKINKKISLFIIFILLIGLLVYPTISAFPNAKSNLIWGNELTESKKTSYLPVQQSGEWIKANSNPRDIVISNSQPQTLYYSERPTYIFDVNHEGVRYQIPELAKYKKGEEGLDEFVKEMKPRYLIVSVFEIHEQWMYSYPEKHKDILKPVQVYSEAQQPTLVIYEFNYLNKSLG